MTIHYKGRAVTQRFTLAKPLIQRGKSLLGQTNYDFILGPHRDAALDEVKIREIQSGEVQKSWVFKGAEINEELILREHGITWSSNPERR